MEKIAIAFVILNYQNIEPTNKCITAIRNNIDTDSYRILVVDNASPNNAYEILCRTYEGYSDIELIKNQNNIGFTRGNNVGISYICSKYEFEFMCVLNSDAYLVETQLVNKLKNYYTKYGFAVAGPLVIGNNDAYTNPQSYDLPSIKYIKSYINKIDMVCLLDRLHGYWIYDVFSEMYLKKKGQRKTDCDYDTPLIGVGLSGCCLFFSQKYFEKCNGLIDQESFYREEELLVFQTKKNNLTTLFAPDIVYRHESGASTKCSYKTKRNRNMWRLREDRKSLSHLYCLIKEAQASGD